MTDSRRRAVVAAAVLLSVAGGFVIDSHVGRTAVATSPPMAASAVVAGSGASTSAWYCPGAAGLPSGTTASLVLTNSSARALVATVVAASSGSGTSAVAGVSFAVLPHVQVALPASGAITVLLDGGGVAAQQVLAGPWGWTTTACSSAPATSWYFAHGSTGSGNSTQLVVYNPTATDAVVDVEFVSSKSGLVVPPADQGIPVSAGSEVVLNDGDHLSDDPSFATEVQALSGQVVASQVSTLGSSGSAGVATTSGVASPSQLSSFALNDDVAGGGNVFDVFNPSSSTAHITVSIALAEGRAAPLYMTVGPRSIATLATAGVTRIPTNTLFGLTFRTGTGSGLSPGPGIVVARESDGPAGSGSPSMGVTTGEPNGARMWLVPAVPSPGTGAWVLAVVDLSTRVVHVSVRGLSASGSSPSATGSSAVPLAPDGLLVIGPPPPPPVGATPVIVSADGPVAIELDPLPSGGAGTVVLAVWPVFDQR